MGRGTPFLAFLLRTKTIFVLRRFSRPRLEMSFRQVSNPRVWGLHTELDRNILISRFELKLCFGHHCLNDTGYMFLRGFLIEVLQNGGNLEAFS